jgi:hypothetical protein
MVVLSIYGSSALEVYGSGGSVNGIETPFVAAVDVPILISPRI